MNIKFELIILLYVAVEAIHCNSIQNNHSIVAVEAIHCNSINTK